MNAATDLTEFDTLKAQVSLFVQPTTSLTVTDTASNAVALGTLKTIKSFANQIEARRVAAVKPLRDRVKEIDAYAKDIALPLDRAELEIKNKMLVFSTLERKQREEEQRKIDAEVRENARLAAEAQRKLEDDARAIRAAAEKQRIEEEARQRQALKEEQEHAAQARAMFGAGPVDKAKEEAEARALAERQVHDARQAALKVEEDRLATAARIEREQQEFTRSAAAARAKLEADRPKNTRQVPKYEIVDLALIPAQFMIADLVRIGSAVRAGSRDIPGVRIWLEDVVVSR